MNDLVSACQIGDDETNDRRDGRAAQQDGFPHTAGERPAGQQAIQFARHDELPVIDGIEPTEVFLVPGFGEAGSHRLVTLLRLAAEIQLGKQLGKRDVLVGVLVDQLF